MDFNLIHSYDNKKFRTNAIIFSLYLIVGGFGNVISFIIFNNKLLKNQTTTVYLKASFVMNIITILYMPIMQLQPIWIKNKINCILFPGTFSLIIQTQAGIMALSSVDRAFSVLKQGKCSFKNSFKIQIIAIISIIFINFLTLFPNSFFYTAESVGNVTLCDFHAES